MQRPTSENSEEYEQSRASGAAQRSAPPQQRDGKIIFYKALAYVTGGLFCLSLAVIPLALLPLLARCRPDIGTYAVAAWSLSVAGAISSAIKTVIPTVFFNIDWTTFIIIGLAVFLSNRFDDARRRCTAMATRRQVKSDLREMENTVHISSRAEVLDPIRKKLESFKGGNKHDREDLLRIFAETKKKLDTMGMDLAFLSIDVVDSTGMKQGEEKALIEHTFKEYKRLVENKMKANGVLKSAWTPDGVMMCFASIDSAVRTARQVIDALPEFNAKVKSIKSDIAIRCGINSGYVYCDDSMPMEEMSDRVIDVAGHMQKHAAPNSIFIAKPAIEPTNEGGFSPASRVIDGYDVYSWTAGPSQGQT